MDTQTKGQLKNRLFYIKRKRRALLKECIKAGVPLPEEYKSLTHDIVVCEINLSQLVENKKNLSQPLRK